MDAVYVHDPCALAAVLRPSLFQWQPGEVGHKKKALQILCGQESSE